MKAKFISRQCGYFLRKMKYYKNSVLKTVWVFFNVHIMSKVVNCMSLKHSCKNNMGIVLIFFVCKKGIQSYGSKIQLSKNGFLQKFLVGKNRKYLLYKREG